MNGKIKVLVVDDSSVARALLIHLLQSDSGIEVMAAVKDGQEAVEFMAVNGPDAILMDLHMPRLDGLEATRQIMETHPAPIIICSGTTDAKEVATTFRLLEAGAVACVEKPVASIHPEYTRVAAKLLQTVKLMSEVRVVRRWRKPRAPVGLATDFGPAELRVAPEALRCVGIGASTGGPPVIKKILDDLPRTFPTPILIVQHIAKGFLPGFADWLSQTAGVHVEIAKRGAALLAGHAYLAPDDFHMGVAGDQVTLVDAEPENGLRPAVSFLFRSLAEAYGARAVGVLLTGMGRDGAAELKLIHDRGGLTIAQDKETSVIHGMPGSAIELGGASRVLPADKIAAMLISATTPRGHVQLTSA